MEREGRGDDWSDDRQVVGPPSSFDDFYRREVRSVLAVTMGLTRRRGEAEEVTQEAFYRAYRDWYQWKLGLVVKDWRFVVRISNIDIPALVLNSSPAPIFTNLIKATHAIPDLDIVDPVIVMNRTVFQMLDIQARANVTSGGQLSYDVVGGKRIVSFRGIPILVMDRIVNTETRVT